MASLLSELLVEGSEIFLKCIFVLLDYLLRFIDSILWGGSTTPAADQHSSSGIHFSSEVRWFCASGRHGIHTTISGTYHAMSLWDRASPQLVLALEVDAGLFQHGFSSHLAKSVAITTISKRSRGCGKEAGTKKRHWVVSLPRFDGVWPRRARGSS